MPKLDIQWKTPPCCDRPEVAVMDHNIFRGDAFTGSPRVNRVCVRCFRHWYGRPNRVREYDRAAWDATFGVSDARERAPMRAKLAAQRAEAIERAAREYLACWADDRDDAADKLRKALAATV
jgi:hypothetical protein